MEEKIRGNASRPFFAVDKLKGFEDKFGIAMCSNYYHNCNNCGNFSYMESLLERCSCCRRFWYCKGNDCSKRGWPRHKEHECKAKWRTNAYNFPSLKYKITKSLIERDTQYGGISMQLDRKTQQLIFLCLDPDTNKMFDGLTDRPVRVIDE